MPFTNAACRWLAVDTVDNMSNEISSPWHASHRRKGRSRGQRLPMLPKWEFLMLTRHTKPMGVGSISHCWHGGDELGGSLCSAVHASRCAPRVPITSTKPACRCVRAERPILQANRPCRVCGWLSLRESIWQGFRRRRLSLDKGVLRVG